MMSKTENTARTPNADSPPPDPRDGSQWLMVAVNDIKERLTKIERKLDEDTEKKTKLYTDMDWMKKLLWAGIAVLVAQFIRSLFE